MSKNLRNVAIPGTGIPLSLYCSFKAMTYFFILVVNPALCLMAAINLQRKHGRCDICASARLLANTPFEIVQPSGVLFLNTVKSAISFG